MGYSDMYARHDLIMESAFLWLEDVNSIKSVSELSKFSLAEPAGRAQPALDLLDRGLRIRVCLFLFSNVPGLSPGSWQV